MIILVLASFFTISTAHAYKPIEIDYRHTGLYGAAGPSVSYDIAPLKKPFFGGNFQLGYRVNEHVSAYLQLDGLYGKGYGVTYLYFPALAKFKASLYKDFFIHAGVGYSAMNASAGNHFARGTTVAKKLYNGFVAESGLAYEWWFQDDYFLSPEIGLNINHIAGDNRFSPYLRLNVGFAITWFDRL